MNTNTATVVFIILASKQATWFGLQVTCIISISDLNSMDHLRMLKSRVLAVVLGIDQFGTQRKYDSSWYIPSSLDPDWQDITRDSLCLRSASSLSRSEPHKLGFQSLVILYTRNRN